MSFLKEIAATAKTEDLDPKEQLQVEISEISEAGYCAGWTRDVEFYLWKIVIDGSETEFGVKTISEQDIANLRTLAKQSGGWWHWFKKENNAVFVTLDEWQEIYQQFSEKESN
ncbi:hypothetical protein C7B70_17115 [Chlorogloea sp. CCALA 695]|nr:hypothetical protein C7B70_17115 [Chlorogloea sp. CCALA 695]